MSCYLSAGHSAACDGRPDSQIVATIAPTRNDSGGMHFKGRFYYSSCNNCEIMDSGGENGCTQLVVDVMVGEAPQSSFSSQN